MKTLIFMSFFPMFHKFLIVLDLTNLTFIFFFKKSEFTRIKIAKNRNCKGVIVHYGGVTKVGHFFPVFTAPLNNPRSVWSLYRRDTRPLVTYWLLYEVIFCTRYLKRPFCVRIIKLVLFLRFNCLFIFLFLLYVNPFKIKGEGDLCILPCFFPFLMCSWYPGESNSLKNI